MAGFGHTVAPLGTALTENQLALLWRMASEPILCFDGDAAGLDDAEPARREHRRIGPAQQHAVAADEAHVLHQHARNAVGLIEQLRVGPVHTVADQTRPVTPAARDGAVQQLGRAVESRRELQLR